MSLQVKCAKEMKGAAVLSTAFRPMFKISGMRLFVQRAVTDVSNATATPLAQPHLSQFAADYTPGGS